MKTLAKKSGSLRKKAARCDSTTKTAPLYALYISVVKIPFSFV